MLGSLVLKWPPAEGNCGQFYRQTEYLDTHACALKIKLFCIYNVFHSILHAGVSALKNDP